LDILTKLEGVCTLSCITSSNDDILSGMSSSRRALLEGLAILPLAAVAAETRAPKIKVTGLETFRVKVNKRGDWLIARLQTSGGVSGIGDASQSGVGPANDARMMDFLHQFFELIKGRSIYDVEYLRTAAMPAAERAKLPAAVALSALEQCLWDIRGKVFGVPAFDLFGGRVQPRIRQYANINRSTDPRTPEGFADMAARAVAASFDAVKLAPFDEMPRDLSNAAVIDEFTSRGIACAEAVRRRIGPKADLLIDAHSHFDLKRGLDLARRLEPLNLFWLEEVTPAVPVDGLAEINRQAKMPTAGGELLLGVKGFYPYIRGQAVDIVMPDVKFCGGMLELKKIAAMAEGAGLLCSPHGPASPVGNVAAAHVCATMPNFNILEFSFGEVPWRAELIDPPERIIDSALPLGDVPGLGISLNEKTASQHAA
jgi:galactonate dehydratase